MNIELLKSIRVAGKPCRAGDVIACSNKKDAQYILARGMGVETEKKPGKAKTAKAD